MLSFGHTPKETGSFCGAVILSDVWAEEVTKETDWESVLDWDTSQVPSVGLIPVAWLGRATWVPGAGEAFQRDWGLGMGCGGAQRL